MITQQEANKIAETVIEELCGRNWTNMKRPIVGEVIRSALLPITHPNWEGDQEMEKCRKCGQNWTAEGICKECWVKLREKEAKHFLGIQTLETTNCKQEKLPMMNRTALNDLLCETGQELDASHAQDEHDTGQLIMFIVAIVGGSTPIKAARSMIEYEEKWQKGTTPYIPKPQ